MTGHRRGSPLLRHLGAVAVGTKADRRRRVLALLEELVDGDPLAIERHATAPRAHGQHVREALNPKDRLAQDAEYRDEEAEDDDDFDREFVRANRLQELAERPRRQIPVLIERE